MSAIPCEFEVRAVFLGIETVAIMRVSLSFARRTDRIRTGLSFGDFVRFRTSIMDVLGVFSGIQNSARIVPKIDELPFFLEVNMQIDAME